MHSLTLPEHAPDLHDTGAIALDRAAWPLVVCRVRRTPSDEEVIATLREQELLLDRAVQHAVLIDQADACRPRLDHILLWRAFEQLHARRLERYCVGRAFVTVLPGERFSTSHAPGVPEARFDDEASARAWLFTRLALRVS